VPIDWLADDAQAGPPPEHHVSEASLAAVDLIEALRLPKEAVIRALHAIAAPAPPGSPVPGMTSYAPPIPTQEEAREILRRRRKK
jgi:hypothetical protein